MEGCKSYRMLTIVSTIWRAEEVHGLARSGLTKRCAKGSGLNIDTPLKISPPKTPVRRTGDNCAGLLFK